MAECFRAAEMQDVALESDSDMLIFLKDGWPDEVAQHSDQFWAEVLIEGRAKFQTVSRAEQSVISH